MAKALPENLAKKRTKRNKKRTRKKKKRKRGQAKAILLRNFRKMRNLKKSS